jgi:hypothetical protein
LVGVSECIRELPIYPFSEEVKFTPAIRIELSSKPRIVLTAHFASKPHHQTNSAH